MVLDDFLVAQKKCSMAKTKSDLSSSEDTLKHRKVRKRKVMKNSDSAGIIFIMIYGILQYWCLLELNLFVISFDLLCEKLPCCGLRVKNNNTENVCIYYHNIVFYLI